MQPQTHRARRLKCKQVPKSSFKLNQAIITGQSVQQEYLTPADLHRGAIINVFGTHITIVDVDKAAEEWCVAFHSRQPISRANPLPGSPSTASTPAPKHQKYPPTLSCRPGPHVQKVSLRCARVGRVCSCIPVPLCPAASDASAQPPRTKSIRIATRNLRAKSARKRMVIALMSTHAIQLLKFFFFDCEFWPVQAPLLCDSTRITRTKKARCVPS